MSTAVLVKSKHMKGIIVAIAIKSVFFGRNLNLVVVIQRKLKKCLSTFPAKKRETTKNNYTQLFGRLVDIYQILLLSKQCSI